MSSNKNANGNDLDISGVDVSFVFECLKSLDEDRQINLTQVAESMGYSNVASVGNRLRSLKKRYGFVNLEGRTAAAAAKAAAAKEETSENSVQTETDRASVPPPKKKGRPARAKSADPNGKGAIGDTTNGTTNGTTDNATNGTSIGNSNGNKKGEKKSSSKRKRDDEIDDTPAGQEPARPTKKARGGRKAAASVEIDETNNGQNTETNTQANGKTKEVVEVNDGAKQVIHVDDEENGATEVDGEDSLQPGKSVRFASLPNSSKPRNAQGRRKAAPPRPTVEPPLDMEELTEMVSRMDKPADRMFLLALETIKEARRERRMRRETPKTGLKLRFRSTAE